MSYTTLHWGNGVSERVTDHPAKAVRLWNVLSLTAVTWSGPLARTPEVEP
jgi:hypothetical protein